MASIDLTEYERKRLENILRNDQMMAALELHSKPTELFVYSKHQGVGAKSFKVGPEKKPKPLAPTITRGSLRTGGMPPDVKALEDDPVESIREAHKPFQSNPLPCKLGPISIMDASRQSGSQSTLIDSILSISKKSQPLEPMLIEPDRSGECNGKERDGSFVTSTDRVAKKVKLDSLTLYPENIARFVPGRIMVVRLFPCAQGQFGSIKNPYVHVLQSCPVLPWIANPITYGEYPETMRSLVGKRLPNFTEAEAKMVKGSIDFFGVNYYSARYAEPSSSVPDFNFSYTTDSHVNLTTQKDVIAIGHETCLDWLYVYPRGLKEMLKYIKKKYNDPVIYVTENGVGDPNIRSIPIESSTK